MKRMFALALTVLMLMAFFTGCCCCDFGLGDEVEDLIGDALQETPGNTDAGLKNEMESDTQRPVEEARPENQYGLLEAGRLTVVTNEFPPYVITDGGFSGIDMEIAMEISRRLDLELVISEMEFSDALSAMEKGQADMMIGGVGWTDYRAEIMDFSNVYATNTQVVLISGRANIKTIDDLQYAKIGVLKNSTAAVYCADDFGEENIRLFDDMRELLMNLSSFRLDCVVIDRSLADYILYNAPVSYLADYSVEDYRIGIAKGNSALKDAIDDVLDDMIADGTIQNIIEEYIHY